MIDKKLKILVEELSTQYEFEEGIKNHLMSLNQFEGIAISTVDMISVTALALLKNVAKISLNPNVMKLERLLEYELLEIDEEDTEVFNGKIVCIETTDTDFTGGKIYEVKEGILEDNFGNHYGEMCLFQNLKEINECMSGVKFIKLIE